LNHQPLFTDDTAKVEPNCVLTTPKKNKEVATAKTAEEEEDKDNGGLTAAVEAALQEQKRKG
jgi:hypothetical protein